MGSLVKAGSYLVSVRVELNTVSQVNRSAEPTCTHLPHWVNPIRVHHAGALIMKEVWRSKLSFSDRFIFICLFPQRKWEDWHCVLPVSPLSVQCYSTYICNAHASIHFIHIMDDLMMTCNPPTDLWCFRSAVFRCFSHQTLANLYSVSLSIT